MRFFPILILMLAACPASAAQVSLAQGAPPASVSQAARPAEQGTPPAKSGLSRLLELYVVQILAVMAALSAASEAAERKDPALSRAIRLAWNWLLLLTFSVCIVLGIALFFPIEKPVKDYVFRLHVWTGAIAGWAGLYHLAKRARSILPR